MSFSDSCAPNSVKLSKGVLSASAKKLDNKTFVPAAINLDERIGFVDGKLVWGGKGFSSAAESVTLAGATLNGKFKTGNKSTESSINLNQYIKNSDGILEVITRPPSPKKVNPITTTPAPTPAPAPALVRGISTASTASAASAISGVSSFSATSTTSSSTSVSTSSSTSTTKSSFSSSHFRRESKLLLIEDTCTHLELKGTILHVDCHRLDGSLVHTHINLDEIIGFVDGRLEWDLHGFSKHCFEYSLDGFFLVVKYHPHQGEHHYDGKHYHIIRLDLRTRLRNKDGVLIIVELNQKLSVMLSEVPWMKFKVIAEPDLSVFARHPVIQETLVNIAETTVEHVTREMHTQLTIAMQAAIEIVMASAMRHVSTQITSLVEGASGHASASPSITGPEHLHIFGGLHAHGYAHGHSHGGVVHASGHSGTSATGTYIPHTGTYSNGHSGTHATGTYIPHTGTYANGHSHGEITYVNGDSHGEVAPVNAPGAQPRILTI